MNQPMHPRKLMHNGNCLPDYRGILLKRRLRIHRWTQNLRGRSEKPLVCRKIQKRNQKSNQQKKQQVCISPLYRLMVTNHSNTAELFTKDGALKAFEARRMKDRPIINVGDVLSFSVKPLMNGSKLVYSHKMEHVTQILKLSGNYHYILKCLMPKPKEGSQNRYEYKPVSGKVIEQSIKDETRWFCKVKDDEKTLSTGDADIYELEECLIGVVDPSNHPHKQKMKSAKWIIAEDVFRNRALKTEFRARVQKYIRAIHLVVKKYDCPRLHWKSWFTTPCLDVKDWFYFVLCNISAGIKDLSLKKATIELVTVWRDPLAIARNPERVKIFLQGVANRPKGDIRPMAEKGLIWWQEKTLALIINSRRLVFWKICGSMNQRFDKLVEKYNHKKFDVYRQKKVHIYHPLPEELIKECEASKHEYLPVTFDINFFIKMHGISHKIAALIAESIYNHYYGPVVDRHVIRFSVSHAMIQCRWNNDKMFLLLRQLFPEQDLGIMLNEVAGCSSQNIADEDMCHQLCTVAKKFGFLPNMQMFLKVLQKS